MIINTCNTDESVLIIAEIGNNHEGDFGRAKEMIWAAAESGVDAVKFQTFQTNRYVNGADPARVAMLDRFQLSFDQFAQLAEEAQKAKVTFLSTPFGVEAASFLNEIVPAFKIASGDNTFYPLIETVAGFGKPILLSCGLASLTQLKYTQSLIANIWETAGIKSELAMLHCVTSYPTEPEDANLGAIGIIAEATSCTPGYSDHTLGIEAAVLSVGCGARIIEKHFTLDKNLSEFRDHQLSADPGELAEMVKRIRHAEKLMGQGAKKQSTTETEIEPVVRRSVTLKHDRPAGHVVTLGDLTWTRPANGLAPGKEANIVGRPLPADTSGGTQLNIGDDGEIICV